MCGNFAHQQPPSGVQVIGFWQRAQRVSIATIMRQAGPAERGFVPACGKADAAHNLWQT
jgi:hypothetical protein